MKQIKKKDLNKVIKLSKLWCEASGVVADVILQELCPARFKAFGVGYTQYGHVVLSIVRLKDKKITLETYYKIFEALGYELV